MNQVFWNGTTPQGITLDGIMKKLINDDLTEGLLYDAPTLDDILSEAEINYFDGIVVPFVRLQTKMLAMRRVMNAVANDEQKIEDEPIISEPFKRLGSAQVAVIFPLKDGQKITVYFHNPDSTPAKITGQDPLISFKFLLNKKDVTIVVAPERGKEIDIRQVAQRIMKLANKNATAFARQNKKNAERLAKIEALDAEIADKKALLAEKEAYLEELKAKQQQQSVATPKENQPVIPLNVYIDNHGFDLNTEQGKKDYREFIRKNLKEKYKNHQGIFNISLGKHVVINNRSINEMVSWSGNPLKLQLIEKIEEIIPIATLLEYQNNVKADKKPNVKGYYHMSAMVNVDYQRIKLKLIFEEDMNGVIQYDFMIMDNEKTTLNSCNWTPDTKPGQLQPTNVANEGQSILDNLLCQTLILDDAKKEDNLNLEIVDIDFKNEAKEKFKEIAQEIPQSLIRYNKPIKIYK